MSKQWILKEQPPLEFFNQFPEQSSILLLLLYHRGVKTQEAIDVFLNPEFETGIHDPFLFRDMHKAVDRIFTAIAQNEKIIIFADYDADGITAAVIGASVFREIGLNEGTDFAVYLPDRDKEGYGLNKTALQLLAERSAKVIITADCGITNIEEVDYANSLGIDVIITDHHSIPNVLPHALAVLNPRLPDETYPCKLLCGAGTLFKLMQGVLGEYEKQHPQDNQVNRESIIKWLFDIAAIGTVADMVPLLEENRVMVKYGLVVLNKTRRVGLRKLIEKALGVNQKTSSFLSPHGGKEKHVFLLQEKRRMVSSSRPPKKLDTYSIGFQIAPRINAAGRLDHSSQSYRLLMSEDENEAENLASNLNATNTQRQHITETMFTQGMEQIASMEPQKMIHCVIGDDWSQGVVGLVAGKLAQEFYRPTIVATRISGKITGSGRSIRELDLIATLRELDPLLFLKLGGHPMACGFTLADGVSFNTFRDALTQRVEEKLNGIKLVPSLDIDTKIRLSDINWPLYDQLEQMQPFGMNNPQPVFLISECDIVEIMPIGREGKHLRLKVRQKDESDMWHEKNCIGFSLGGRATEIASGDIINLVATIDVNEWNGNRELQLKVIDFQKF